MNSESWKRFEEYFDVFKEVVIKNLPWQSLGLLFWIYSFFYCGNSFDKFWGSWYSVFSLFALWKLLQQILSFRLLCFISLLSVWKCLYRTLTFRGHFFSRLFLRKCFSRIVRFVFTFSLCFDYGNAFTEFWGSGYCFVVEIPKLCHESGTGDSLVITNNSF